MTRRTYRPRVVDREVSDAMSALGAVAIEGPKACGKTESARQHAGSEVLLDLDPQAALAARVDPRLVLDGPTPRLLDEWQIVPEIWNAVRRAVDDRGLAGQFLLTGSARRPADIRRHGGAGRFSIVQMRPMTLFERGKSSGAASISRLLDGEGPEPARSELTVRDYASEVATGGWPALLMADEQAAVRFNRGYVDTIVDIDIHTVDGVRRDPVRVRRFLHAFAQVVAHPARLATIVQRAAGEDAGGGAGGGPSRWTGTEYLDALARLMVVEDQPAWQPELRSRSRLTAAPKRHLADPALAAALLHRDAAGLLGDLRTFGFLFESLVVRDLRVFAQAARASVLHYREEKGDLECDAVIEREDGAWAAFEVKLGAADIDAAATALLRLAGRTVRKPACLGVLTATGYTYRRDDGVLVIPVGALGP
ncbi:MAG: ATP-binding protein [Candidatus Sericytochromatia bacterium]|nr:ATP-binding protein [Candidatus Tanganyikabacteria bacterium]